MKPKPCVGGEKRPAPYKRGRSPLWGAAARLVKDVYSGFCAKGIPRFFKSVKGKKQNPDRPLQKAKGLSPQHAGEVPCRKLPDVSKETQRFARPA